MDEFLLELVFMYEEEFMIYFVIINKFILRERFMVILKFTKKKKEEVKTDFVIGIFIIKISE